MKELIKKIPVFGELAKRLYLSWIHTPEPFPGSTEYWRQRYQAGGNSGAGSYNELAEFKAEVLNGFVRENNIRTVIEYGFGDGNQLKLAEYPSYVGFEVSPEAVSCCKSIFAQDNTKTFGLIEQYAGETAQLTLSLDVIFHLVEDNVYTKYMEQLLNSSTAYVIIYSSNTDDNSDNRAEHVRHRKFSDWIEATEPQWKLLRHIPNRYPYRVDGDKESFSDFYIYVKSVL